MLKIKVYVFFLVCLLLLTGACGLFGPASKPYVSEADSFSVTFPAGGSKEEPEVRKEGSGSTAKSTYMAINNNGIYKVIVSFNDNDMSSDLMKEKKNLADKLYLTGAQFPMDPENKEMTFQGMQAVDSTGWSWSDNPGPDGLSVKLQERKVAFLDIGRKKLYEIVIKSNKKENLSSKEAEEFIKSFKLGGAAK